MSAAGEPSIKEQETQLAANKAATGKVLLLSAVPPSVKYSGALMLNAMCRALSPDSLSCFAVLTKGMRSEIHEEWRHIPYEHRQKPRECHHRQFPLHLGVVESFLKEQSTAASAIPKLTDEIIDFAKKAGAEKIWVTLEGQTLIRLAASLQERLPLPMVAQVWDPPNWWLRDNNVDPISRKDILKTFGKVLSNPNTTVAAASWAMAETYQKEFGSKAIPVVPGLPKDWAREPASQLNSSSTLTIGFAGQLYSGDEWISLMDALDSLNWQIEGRAVEIKLLGRTFELHANGHRNIKIFGWRSQPETLQILSECDILYCPYWFSPKYETEARLSFPSKLTSYLAAGRPVLFHGPKYSSPSRFIGQHDAALQCNTMNRKDIVDALVKLVAEPDEYRRFAINGTKAFHSQLTEDAMQAQFLKALNV